MGAVEKHDDERTETAGKSSRKRRRQVIGKEELKDAVGGREDGVIVLIEVSKNTTYRGER